MTTTTSMGLIFDLDGTLIESAPAITAVANEFLATFDLQPITREQTISFIGGGSQQFVRLMLESRDGYVAHDFESHYAIFSKIYSQASPGLNTPFPGVDAALREMVAKGHPLAICTNKPAAPTQRIVDALGWSELFGAVVAGDTLPVKKPDPAPLHEAARRIGCEALLYFGDSETDAETAERAGHPFVLFTEGYRKSSIDEIAKTASFSDFAQLRSIVDRLRPG